MVTTSPPDVFTVKRRVAFGDTDVAGSLFFSNVTRYCMEALEEWFVDRLGTDWYHLNVDRAIGTPFVRAEFDFVSAATPRESLELQVAVTGVGRSSVDFAVTANTVPSGRGCWVARFKCVFIDAGTKRATPIPGEYRTTLERESLLWDKIQNARQ
jgi:acyl-CoA thioesterase FadM